MFVHRLFWLSPLRHLSYRVVSCRVGSCHVDGGIFVPCLPRRCERERERAIEILLPSKVYSHSLAFAFLDWTWYVTVSLNAPFFFGSFWYFPCLSLSPRTCSTRRTQIRTLHAHVFNNTNDTQHVCRKQNCAPKERAPDGISEVNSFLIFFFVSVVNVNVNVNMCVCVLICFPVYLYLSISILSTLLCLSLSVCLCLSMGLSLHPVHYCVVYSIGCMWCCCSVYWVRCAV
jgi:hypothetical protein